MSRKVHEISFAIAGKLASTFKGAFSSATSQLSRLQKDAKNLKSKLSELDNHYKKGSIDVQTYTTAHQRLTTQLQNTLAVQQKLSAATQRQNELHSNASQLRGQVVDTAAMASPFVVAANQAMAFEDAMIGVARQVQGARDGNGQLTQIYYQMGKQIQGLGREIPLATNEIAEMVTAGARMGVAREELIKFTRTSAMMATAFDAPAGELAEKMGKVAGNFKIPITAISELADSINYLDDNAISKGSDIIEVLNRISGQAQQVGMSAKDATALASTFLTTGASAEVAATAANAMMRELALAAEQPDRFQKGMKALGLNSKQIQKDMTKDATGTIQKVLAAINKLPKDKQTAVTVQLFGKEYGDDAARLAQNLGEFRRQLSLANGEAAKGSMSREFAVRLQTSSAQLQILKNKATEVAVNLGSVFLPAVNQAFDKTGAVAIKISEFAQAHPALTKAILGTTAGIIGFRIAWVSASFVFNQGKAIVSDLASLFIRQAAAQASATTATTIATAATGRLTIAQRLLNVAMRLNPIGMVITAIGALVAAGVYLYNNNETVRKKLDELWAGFKKAPEIALAVTGPFGAIVAAGITLYKNWDTVKERALNLWDTLYNYFANGANRVIDTINPLIEAMNKVTGTNFSTIGKIQLVNHREGKTSVADFKKYARGGIVTRPTLGMVAEAGYSEAIIPLKRDANSISLWQKTGQALGMMQNQHASENNRNNGTSIWGRSSKIVNNNKGTVINQFYFSPSISAGTPAEVKQELENQRLPFERQMDTWISKQKRLAFD